ncbi:MAG: hypothetical protein L6V85_03640 [Clostridiales bacterium]|nr:MAG: hypothetical protein L6V85_03640 [Clostridiales bacterium]
MAKNKKSTGLSLSTVFSLISMVLFIVKTVNSFSEGAKAGGASGIIKFAVLPLIIVFAICFFVQVIASIKDQKAVKESIGDAKYQIKTTKKVASIMEAVVELVSVIVAILLAYDEYASGNIKWYNFRYYFTLIILLFTFLSTVYYIVKTSLKLKKSSDKRKEQQAKALEKAQKKRKKDKKTNRGCHRGKGAPRRRKKKRRNRRQCQKKDQSHKPVKKIHEKNKQIFSIVYTENILLNSL